MQKVRTTYFSLGSNTGNKINILQEALYLIDDQIGQIKKVSSVFKTQSWGFTSNNFLNICIELSVKWSPEDLIGKVLHIEMELGRKRTVSDKYSDRNIDIDILLYETEIIDHDNLKVPHPKMLDRKFVLVPLEEIASNYIHPMIKKPIRFCLENCNDSGDIEKTNFLLTLPKSIAEKFNYIAIEGNIGSGKTSLTEKIGKDFNANIVLERFADNPFLPKFYKDKERYAFTLEMSFLAERYSQLTTGMVQFDLSTGFIVSDYFMFKSLIFAQITLAEEEYKLYHKMFDMMYKEVSKPDIYIYLYQNTKRLLENIKKRGRSYEKNIQAEYLDKIHQGYMNFIKTREGSNTLIIDITKLDFVNNEGDYNWIINKIIDFKK